MSNAQRKARKKAGIKFEREPKRPTTKYLSKGEARKARRAADQALSTALQAAAGAVRREVIEEMEQKR